LVKDEAKQFKNLQTVYVLAAVNSTFSEGNEWYHTLKIMNPKNHDVVLEGLEFILLELPKFNPETWSLAQKKLAILWLRFLKEIEGYHHELPEEFTSNELIYSAIKKCEEAALTYEERIAYELSEEQAMWDRSIKGLEDTVVENAKIIAEKNQALAENAQALAEKDKTIADLSKELAEMRKTLSTIKK